MKRTKVTIHEELRKQLLEAINCSAKVTNNFSENALLLNNLFRITSEVINERGKAFDEISTVLDGLDLSVLPTGYTIGSVALDAEIENLIDISLKIQKLIYDKNYDNSSLEYRVIACLHKKNHSGLNENTLVNDRIKELSNSKDTSCFYETFKKYTEDYQRCSDLKQVDELADKIADELITLNLVSKMA